jgi:hypothetical protein
MADSLGWDLAGAAADKMLMWGQPPRLSRRKGSEARGTRIPRLTLSFPLN